MTDGGADGTPPRCLFVGPTGTIWRVVTGAENAHALGSTWTLMPSPARIAETDGRQRPLADHVVLLAQNRGVQLWLSSPVKRS